MDVSIYEARSCSEIVVKIIHFAKNNHILSDATCIFKYLDKYQSLWVVFWFLNLIDDVS